MARKNEIGACQIRMILRSIDKGAIVLQSTLSATVAFDSSEDVGIDLNDREIVIIRNRGADTVPVTFKDFDARQGEATAVIMFSPRQPRTIALRAGMQVSVNLTPGEALTIRTNMWNEARVRPGGRQTMGRAFT